MLRFFLIFLLERRIKRIIEVKKGRTGIIKEIVKIRASALDFQIKAYEDQSSAKNEASEFNLLVKDRCVEKDLTGKVTSKHRGYAKIKVLFLILIYKRNDAKAKEEKRIKEKQDVIRNELSKKTDYEMKIKQWKQRGKFKFNLLQKSKPWKILKLN